LLQTLVGVFFSLFLWPYINFGPNVKSSQISHCSLQQQQYILLVPRKLGYARVETQYDPPAKREKKEKYIQGINNDIIGGSKACSWFRHVNSCFPCTPIQGQLFVHIIVRLILVDLVNQVDMSTVYLDMGAIM